MLINLNKDELEEIYKSLMYYRYYFEDKDGIKEKEKLNKLIDRFADECIYYS